MAETKSLVRKTSISPTSTWIKLDATGHSSLLNMDKYDIIHRLKIHARDLRILDPILSYPSTILGREKAIVLNLEHIKAIITAEEVFLLDPADENVVPVVEELQRRLSAIDTNQGDDYDIEIDENNESPFEFRALEALLEVVCSYLAARTKELEMATYPALDELTTKITSRNLDKVRKLKSAMTRLTARVQKVRDELEQLIYDDDNMADLYLSRKSSKLLSPLDVSSWFVTSPTRGSKLSNGDENDVEELEMLLEAYFMDIDHTFNKLTTLRGYVDDTEDYINIQIDNHRNQLIQVVLFTAILSAIMFLAIITSPRKKGLVGS
ncbi:magnesium transporter MRS2-2-like isoform X2 [Lotus japonicus]|uniref:magnesium transporter MRS2-2-like isoform X2 n=1 Tax=Lotus japonicus TaxID=34305 RepID=UPI00258A645C|nr:magnesium transporter MRS2-2-like isoform X2 [Lotus japonicus]